MEVSRSLMELRGEDGYRVALLDGNESNWEREKGRNTKAKFQLFSLHNM